MLKDRGQISIFFSTAVVVMITIMAFIINIGLFVKAKINLQNAVDAAAYAGASVQARQLTNIGYMNWAMRNVYKEWMFKYYVLGGLSLEGVSGVTLPGTACPGPSKTTGDRKDFTMGCYTRTSIAGGAQDNYNFPSVCIDFANTGQVGLCTRFLVPGLPRFTRQNVLGMDETTNAFIDSIVAEKSTDCSKRTELNFLTANTWAYNVTETDIPNSIRDQAPQMAINYMGAFPHAFEIGVRIRNLESEVNFPPVAGVCGDLGSGINCSRSANSLTTSHQERTLKAYTSAFRNLGNQDDNEMKDSFTLTELAPNIGNENIDTGLSYLLIPNEPEKRRKIYLDLKLITANYAPFYTAFATSQGDIKVNNQVIDSEGQCTVTKMGLPVPGYPLHFVKNPDFLTYYAVQGQAQWMGLFNPFANDIILTAYAAAKPFGGRIGPQIFDVSDDRAIRQRTTRKSSPYISALNTQSFKDVNGQEVAPGEYAPGFPVPINAGSDGDQFWMTGAGETIGGFIPDGNSVFFGVPNLVYEYPRRDPQSAQTYFAETPVQAISYKGEGPAPKAGLYNGDMFSFFASNLSGLGGTVTTPAIGQALVAVSAPTLYETHNFLVPTPETLNREFETDSYGVIPGRPESMSSGSRNFEVWRNAELYGPLFDDGNPNSLFRGPADLRAVLEDYLQRQEPAILKYKSSMNLVAADIYTRNKSRATGQDTGLDAARVISDLPIPIYEGPIETIKEAAPTCDSIAGKFIWFYTGDPSLLSDASTCPPNDNLPELLQSRWNATNFPVRRYRFDYALETGEFRSNLFSAYRPGGFRLTNNEGLQSNPASSSGRQEVKLRNSYSVKFIPLKSVTTSGDGAAYRTGETMLIYSEGSSNSISNEAQRERFKNPLNLSALGIDIDH